MLARLLPASTSAFLDLKLLDELDQRGLYLPGIDACFIDEVFDLKALEFLEQLQNAAFGRLAIVAERFDADLIGGEAKDRFELSVIRILGKLEQEILELIGVCGAVSIDHQVGKGRMRKVGLTRGFIRLGCNVGRCNFR